MSETGTAITVDDLRTKAYHVKDVATLEARALVRDRRTQIVIFGVVAAVVVVSLAYHMGSRR